MMADLCLNSGSAIHLLYDLKEASQTFSNLKGFFNDNNKNQLGKKKSQSTGELHKTK